MGTCGDHAILGCDGNGSFRALCFSSVDLFPVGSRIAASFDSEHETINGNREDAENDSVGRGILSDFGSVAWGGYLRFFIRDEIRRNLYLQVYDRYANKPLAHVISQDLYLERTGDRLEVKGDLLLSNK